MSSTSTALRDGPRQDRPAASGPAVQEGTSSSLRRRDPLDAQGLVRFFVKPAAFLATNWAAMLGILTVAGIVPALAAATRVTGNLPQHEDSAFRSAVQHMRGTFRRDAPASLLLLLVFGGVAANGLLLPQLDPSIRVFVVGVLLPVIWGLVALLSAYVTVASRGAEPSREEVVLSAISLVIRRPVAALLAPALIAILSPLWLLAPITIACGFSVPPWVLGRLWGSTAPGH